MKRSEQLKAELDRINQENDKVLKETVFYPGHTPEGHEIEWASYWEAYGRNHSAMEKQLQFEIRKEENREAAVDDGVTVCLYSDRHAATVVKRTATRITVQHDKAVLDPNFKPDFIPGGFSAHCTNQHKQSYTYERDPEGRIETFNWSEKRGRWQGGGDGSIVLILGRHEFYNYNF